MAINSVGAMSSNICTRIITSISVSRPASTRWPMRRVSNHARAQAYTTVAVPMAKAYASDMAKNVTSEAIQVHGGIGFTWEHDMQLYFKRAKSSEVTFGDANFNREIVARLIGL